MITRPPEAEAQLPQCAAGCGEPSDWLIWGHRVCSRCFSDFDQEQGHLLECGNLDNGRTPEEARAEAKLIVAAWVSNKRARAA